MTEENQPTFGELQEELTKLRNTLERRWSFQRIRQGRRSLLERYKDLLTRQLEMLSQEDLAKAELDGLPDLLTQWDLRTADLGRVQATLDYASQLILGVRGKELQIDSGEMPVQSDAPWLYP